jgi:hypothetical protein
MYGKLSSEMQPIYLSAAYIMDILFSEVDFSNLVTI